MRTCDVRQPSVCSLKPGHTVTPQSSVASSSTPDDYSRHVHFMGISHAAQLMSFLYTLPSYLQENPKVLKSASIVFILVRFG